MIAWRYITGSMYERSLSIMVVISCMGIFIGSCALALVAAIMHGFDTQTRKQMQSIHPQASIQSSDPIDFEHLKEVLQTEFPAITALSPTSSAFGLSSSASAEATADNKANEPIVVIIEAIDPETTSQVTSLHEKIITELPLTVLAEDSNAVFIGSSLADDLNIAIGDIIDLLYASDQQPHNKKLVFNSHEVTVAGIIKTGYEDLDGRLVLCSFALFNELFPDVGIRKVQLHFAPHINIPETIMALRARLGLEVYTWQDLYPAMLAALTLEEYVYFLVIALITLVASMNILALLFMQITSKRTDIALLKTLGFDDGAITKIFIYMGLGISLCATVCGIICATILSYCIETYQLIPLPDAYYVSHVPAEMTPLILVLVLAVVTIMSLIATIIPTRRIHTMSVASILRFEG
jgi:lipoprotein-releasing system permease protein